MYNLEFHLSTIDKLLHSNLFLSKKKENDSTSFETRLTQLTYMGYYCIRSDYSLAQNNSAGKYT